MMRYNKTSCFTSVNKALNERRKAFYDSKTSCFTTRSGSVITIINDTLVK